MNRLFQTIVITWIGFHVLWILLSLNIPFLEMVAVALVVVGFWMFFGMLLLRHNRLVRLLLLLAVIGWVIFLWKQSDLWMLEYHDFESMAKDPSIGWAKSISLLLSGVLLVIAYLTPVAAEFEARKAVSRTKLSQILAAVTRTDGTIITVSTVAVLIVFVVNQFVISAQYEENSPHVLISKLSEYLKSVEATGDKKERRDIYFALGDTYWLVNKRGQAASMYEKVVTLTPKDLDFADWELSHSVVRLMQYYVAEPNARFGHGSHILKLAQRVTGDARDANYFDALAAVHARLGQYKKAVQNQKAAIEECALTGCCEKHWEYVDRLNEYSIGLN